MIVSAVLLCLAAGLAFAMRRSRGNRDSVFAKALFRTKSARVFPVRSLAYGFFAAVTLFFALSIVEKASGRDRYLHEDLVKAMMGFEKYNAGLDYPLMAIKGSTEINRERPRILVLGDSFVWGYALSNVNQIWWRVMAGELERRGYDCQVIAVAYPGAGTAEELEWLRDTPLLEDIDPDLILIGYVTNDHYDQMVGGVYDPVWLSFLADRTQALATPIRTDVFFPELYQFLDLKIYKKHMDYGFSYIPVDRGMLPGYERDVLRPLGELAREAGIPLAVIPTPETPRRGFETVYRVILPLFEQAGMPVYNPLDEFIKKYPNYSNPYFSASRIDMHPGPASSWFLGEYAADAVERNYAAILGEKRGGERALPIEINDWLPLMLEPRAIQESDRVSQYVIEYPDQSSRPDFENHDHGNFLVLPLRRKYVKLNFKNPVRLSRVKIEGEELLSAEVWTLGINKTLGFDDQRPNRLGRRRGGQCQWADRSGRYVTSLLVSARTVDGKQAALTVTIEGP